MTEIASRELRNQTRSLLKRVQAGESVTITVGGKPVALLQPVGRRPIWMSREEFSKQVMASQADPGLRRDLNELAPDMTDGMKVP